MNTDVGSLAEKIRWHHVMHQHPGSDNQNNISTPKMVIVCAKPLTVSGCTENRENEATDSSSAKLDYRFVVQAIRYFSSCHWQTFPINTRTPILSFSHATSTRSDTGWPIRDAQSQKSCDFGAYNCEWELRKLPLGYIWNL